MFHGTVIEELFQIVERAEDHAHPADANAQNPESMYPAFLAELLNATPSLVGVA